MSINGYSTRTWYVQHLIGRHVCDWVPAGMCHFFSFLFHFSYSCFGWSVEFDSFLAWIWFGPFVSSVWIVLVVSSVKLSLGAYRMCVKNISPCDVVRYSSIVLLFIIYCSRCLLFCMCRHSKFCRIVELFAKTNSWLKYTSKKEAFTSSQSRLKPLSPMIQQISPMIQ